MRELGCNFLEEEIITGLHTSSTLGNRTKSFVTKRFNGAKQNCDQVLQPRGGQDQEDRNVHRSPAQCPSDRLGEVARLQHRRLPAGGAAPDAQEGQSLTVWRGEPVRPSPEGQFWVERTQVLLPRRLGGWEGG